MTIIKHLMFLSLGTALSLPITAFAEMKADQSHSSSITGSKTISSVVTADPITLAPTVEGVSPATKQQQAKSTDKKAPFKLPFDLYRLPVTPEPTTAQRMLSCGDLEREIARLQPLTYSYQPGFYEDPYQGAAVTIGTTMFMPAYFASGFIAYLDFQEKGRIISAEEKIELLRRLKAEKRCFES